MSCLNLTRHQIILQPESARVIIRPFIPSSARSIAAIIGRTLALTEDEVEMEIRAVRADFDGRHFDIEPTLLEHFARVQSDIFTQRPLSRSRQLLIGALWNPQHCSIPPSCPTPIKATSLRADYALS